MSVDAQSKFEVFGVRTTTSSRDYHRDICTIDSLSRTRTHELCRRRRVCVFRERALIISGRIRKHYTTTTRTQEPRKYDTSPMDTATTALLPKRRRWGQQTFHRIMINLSYPARGGAIRLCVCVFFYPSVMLIRAAALSIMSRKFSRPHPSHKRTTAEICVRRSRRAGQSLPVCGIRCTRRPPRVRRTADDEHLRP